MLATCSPNVLFWDARLDRVQILHIAIRNTPLDYSAGNLSLAVCSWESPGPRQVAGTHPWITVLCLCACLVEFRTSRTQSTSRGVSPEYGAVFCSWMETVQNLSTMRLAAMHLLHIMSGPFSWLGRVQTVQDLWGYLRTMNSWTMAQGLVLWWMEFELSRTCQLGW